MSIRIHTMYLQVKNLIKNNTFVLMSDIHSDEEKLEEIYNVIDSNIHPSFIAIPGDVYDCVNDSRNQIVKQIIEYYGNQYQHFITLGNHDLANYYYKNHRCTIVPSDNREFFEDLGPKIKVFENDNEGIKIDGTNIKIYGMEFPIEWYQNKEDKQQFNNRLNSYNFDKDMLNILLFHTPNNFIDKDGNLINFNLDGENVLILSGHNHGGLVPYKLQKIIPKNRGIIGPYNRIIPKYAYGEYSGNNSCLIISDGVTKIHASDNGKYIAPIGEKILYPDIYIINIEQNKSLNNSYKQLVLTKKETTIYK